MKTAHFFHPLLCLMACGFASSPSPGAESAGRSPVTISIGAPSVDPSISLLRSLIQSYQTDQEALQRRYASALPQFLADRTVEHIRQSRENLERVNFDALDQASKIDFVLLKSRLTFDAYEAQRERKLQEELTAWLPFREGLTRMITTDRGSGELDAGQMAKEASALAGSAVKATRDLESELKKHKPGESGVPTQVQGNRAAQLLDRLRNQVRDWGGFYNGYDPEFSWWMKAPLEGLQKALSDLANVMRRDVIGIKEGEDAPLVGDPIGRDALMQALESEMIPYTPEELIRIGEQEFRWCEREWKRAASDLGFGEDWRKALNHVANLHVKPGHQPRLIRELADEAVKFLEERDLVTIPSLCKEIWRMEMMSPERQKVNPYFTGGEIISISFPTDTMAHEEKVMSLRGNNVHFCRATVHHELIPGHHLQLFMAERFRTHRALFRTPFLVEGWALYWEMLLWDLGFPKTAEDRVGMLFWRTHRCARIVFSLNFHMGRMSAQEAVDYLITKVGHEPRNAAAEVRRSILGAYGPLYQAAYMLGGLQFRALRQELVESGKMTHRAFHDAILRENAIPVEMIRSSLSGHAPSRDFQSQWKFYTFEPESR